ncbi:hypothetical protein Tco_0838927 [Tanacetum coccineum]|uniref:RNA-directed DNA polymerase, eukaryota n=1 Tax=Tanacetum coccineum TaxID=301880 RepID=A0ABQ5AP80_9ASTR
MCLTRNDNPGWVPEFVFDLMDVHDESEEGCLKETLQLAMVRSTLMMLTISRWWRLCSSRIERQKILWDYLEYIINRWDGEVLIMGDFNEVRRKTERFGSVFNVQGADMFNSFIANAGLEEIPLGASDDYVSIMSKAKIMGVQKWEWQHVQYTSWDGNSFDKVNLVLSNWEIKSFQMESLIDEIVLGDFIPINDSLWSREESSSSQFKELTDLLIPIVLNPCPDRWFWSLEGSGEFFVASIRRFIDDQRLLTVDSKTLWIKVSRLRVNILLGKSNWKASRDSYISP